MRLQSIDSETGKSEFEFFVNASSIELIFQYRIKSHEKSAIVIARNEYTSTWKVLKIRTRLLTLKSLIGSPPLNSLVIFK